jgi:hypothetical protein
MSQDIPTEDFDWISARSACSPSQIFQKLRLQIENDVKKRIEIMTDTEKAKCRFFTDYDPGRLSVMVEGERLNEGVIFSRSPAGVEVRDSESNSLIHEGILTLSNDGHCRLKVGDVEYDLWQFRKLSLENVLFTSIAKWRL